MIERGDLELISSTIEEMNEVKRFEDVSNSIFDFLRKYTSFNMAIIYKIDRNDNYLKVISCLGTDIINLKKRTPFRIGEGAVGQAALTKKPVLVKDALHDVSIGIRQFYHEDPLIRSFIAVPLISRGEVKGMLSVSSSNENQYSEYDVRMISVIASQGTLLMELNNKISSTTALSNAVIENVSNGVILMDQNGRIILINKAVEEITGYSRRTLIGASAFDILNFEVVLNGNRYPISQIHTEINEIPGFLNTFENETIELKVSFSFIKEDDEKEDKLTICLFRDITELNLIEKQLRLSDRLATIGRMTSSITHEIRNPLLPISNASEFLYQKYGHENNDLGLMLGIILEECKRLNHLINRMSNLYKIEGPDTDICNPIEVTLKVTDLLRYAIDNNKIEFKTELTEEIIFIDISADNFKQLLINVLLNAMDALQEIEQRKKSILLKIEKNERLCVLKIFDSGIGISKKNLDRIFDPFFTTKENGMGMGMVMVANLVNKANGHINIESVVNKYTEITIKLPISDRME